MKNKYRYVILIVVAIIAVGLVYSFVIRPHKYRYNGGQVKLESIYSNALTDGFIHLAVKDNHIYECSKNGLTKKNRKGELIWSKSFYMVSPIMSSSKKYIAIGELNGKNVYVFDQDKLQYEVKESSPIYNISINDLGYLVVVLEKEDQNIIKYYNNTGELLIARRTVFQTDGYPIDVKVSNDITKMVTGYASIAKNRLQSNVTFFGFGDKYDKYDEKIVGGEVFEDSLISDFIWLSDRKVVAVFDNYLVVYDWEKEPEKIAQIPLDAELKKLVTTDNEIVALYGQSTNNNGQETEDRLVTYDFSGKVIMNQQFEQSIRDLVGYRDSYYVVTGDHIICFKGSKREWFADTHLLINHLYPLNDQIYVVLTNNEYKILRINE